MNAIVKLEPADLSVHPGSARPPLVAAQAVSKVYRMGEEVVQAIHNVSFEVARGEFIAIMGRSGSGKSTTMNLIGALDVPTEGKMLIDGMNISTLSHDALATLRNRTIGFVFQQFNLLPRATALEQVMLPMLYAHPRPTDAAVRARHLLETVGLGDRIDHYPTQLSGGQQQRVAIARALANSPKLLLADEPTGALDTGTSAKIMNLLSDLNKEGITIVVVTHDPETAAFAQRQLSFCDGRIIEDVLQSSPTAGHQYHRVPA